MIQLAFLRLDSDRICLKQLESYRYRDVAEFLLQYLQLIFFIIILCLITISQANSQFIQQGSKLVGTGVVGNAWQGTSVSISADGNTAIIGGPHDSSNVGAAWIWTRSGGVWSQQGTKLVGAGAVSTSNDLGQGISVAISADGNTVIVGGLQDSAGTGAAWVWTRTGGIWSQQGTKLVGTGAAGTAEQGQSVSLSADGNTAIVGGPFDSSYVGAAWVWTRSGGIWTQQGGKLVGSDATLRSFQDYSVSLSADGNTAIVGGPFDNNNGGAAWIWTRSGGVWSQQGNKLFAPGAISTAYQGIAVSLSGDGNTAMVGGYTDNSNAGAVWVWTRSGAVWTQQGSKLVGSGAAGPAYQGVSVSLSFDGDSAIVGGNGDNGGIGAAWIFTRSAGAWSQQGSKLVGTGSAGTSSQGVSVSLSSDGNRAIVGGMGDYPDGAVWIYSSHLDPVLRSLTNSLSFSATKLRDTSSLTANFICGDTLPVIISSITNSNPNFFYSQVLPDTLNYNDTLKIKISFSPTNFGSETDTLKLTSDGGNAIISLNGSSPYPTLILNSSSLAFGSLGAHQTRQMAVKVTNNSVNQLIIDTIYTKTSVYTVDKKNGTVGMDTLVLNVTFSPTTGGSFADTLYLHNNSSTAYVKIPLGGISPLPSIQFSTRRIMFGNVGIYDTSSFNIVVTDPSPAPLRVDSIVNRTPEFIPSMRNFSVNNNDTVNLILRLVPTQYGIQTDSLLVWSNANTYLIYVDLSANVPYPGILTHPPKIHFGTVKKDTTRQLVFSIQDTSISRLRIDSLWTNTKHFDVVHHLANWIIKKADSIAISIRFTPDTSGQFIDTLYIANSSLTSPAKIPISGNGTATGVMQYGDNIPTVYVLYQNYPNPFNPSTSFSFALPSKAYVIFKVFDVLGREVSTIVSGELPAGTYTRQWNAANMPSGVYFYHLQAGTYSATKKLLLLK